MGWGPEVRFLLLGISSGNGILEGEGEEDGEGDRKGEGQGVLSSIAGTHCGALLNRIYSINRRPRLSAALAWP